jgi:epsilon-lactone hydrolase
MASAESLMVKNMIREQMGAVFQSATPPTVEEQRLFLDGLADVAPLPEGTNVQEVEVDGIHAEWVTGAGASEDKVLLYLHGGGYTLGSCKSHRDLAARLSQSSGAKVLLPEYRLAPEHVYPAGLEDATKAYHWLLKQGYQAGSIAIGGDSAGGGLTLATLMALRDANDVPLPACAVLLSPWTDLLAQGESHTTRASLDPMISTGAAKSSAQTYVGEGGDLSQGLVSPLYGNYVGLPPMLFHVGDEEILLDDTIGAAKNAESAGVQTTVKVWDEMWHVFQQSASAVPESQQSIDELGAFIKAHLK